VLLPVGPVAVLPVAAGHRVAGAVVVIIAVELVVAGPVARQGLLVLHLACPRVGRHALADHQYAARLH
jgi:hypothetical protein